MASLKIGSKSVKIINKYEQKITINMENNYIDNSTDGPWLTLVDGLSVCKFERMFSGKTALS